VSWNRFGWERELLRSDLSTGPKLLALVLAGHADREGCCFPSISILSQETSGSERSVQGWLKSLADAGWVMATLGGGRGRRTDYRLTAPNPAAVAGFGSAKDDHGDANPATAAGFEVPSGAHEDTNPAAIAPFVDENPAAIAPFMDENPATVARNPATVARNPADFSKPPTPPVEEEQPKNNPGNIASCNARDPQPQQDGSSLSLGGGEPPLPPSCIQEPPRASEEAQPSDPAHSAGSRPAPKVNGAVVGEDQRPKPDPAPTSPPPSDPASSQVHAPAHKPSNHDRLSALMGMFGHKKPSDAPLGPPTLPKLASVPGPSARPPKHTRKHHNPKPTTR
jgi:hypothetical protein